MELVSTDFVEQFDADKGRSEAQEYCRLGGSGEHAFRIDMEAIDIVKEAVVGLSHDGQTLGLRERAVTPLRIIGDQSIMDHADRVDIHDGSGPHHP